MKKEWGVNTGAFARNCMTGKTFGRLVVGEEVPHKKPGPRLFLCKCSCGNEKVVAGANLRNGSTRSCGCWEKTHARKRPFEWLYNRFLRCAEAAKKAVSITFEDFVEYTAETECHYCEAPITWSEFASDNGKWESSAYNLDRMDTSKGYDKDNIVVCCKRCNIAKGDRFTYEEWVKIGAVIHAFD